MVNQEILDYIKKELARGISESHLRLVLIEHGWPESEINESFEKVKEQSKTAEKIKPIKETASAKVEEGPEIKEEVMENQLMTAIKNVITNKIFIISVAVIIFVAVISFIIPSLFEGTSTDFEGTSADETTIQAQNTCRQYCNSNMCGLFNNPEFVQPTLAGKTCEEIGVKCLQADGEPKCRIEY